MPYSKELGMLEVESGSLPQAAVKLNQTSICLSLSSFCCDRLDLTLF
jgi:hypothetical protein